MSWHAYPCFFRIVLTLFAETHSNACRSRPFHPSSVVDKPDPPVVAEGNLRDGGGFLRQSWNSSYRGGPYSSRRKGGFERKLFHADHDPRTVQTHVGRDAPSREDQSDEIGMGDDGDDCRPSVLFHLPVWAKWAASSHACNVYRPESNGRFHWERRGIDSDGTVSFVCILSVCSSFKYS